MCRRFSIRLITSLALLALSCLRSPAADDASRFSVDSWSVEEGLPGNEVIAVVQTHDGYLWIGTLFGLVRFDGDRFTIFNQANTPALGSDRIVFLFEDRAGNLWVGTDSGQLLAIRDGTVKNFGTPANGRKITIAREQPDGDLLFGSDRGVVDYHAGRMSFAPNIAAPMLSTSIVPSKSGDFWEILGDVVHRWKDNRIEKDLGQSPWGNAYVTAALEDDKTNLVVGTLGKGIFWLGADGRWQNISTNQGLSSEFVLSLCQDRDGNLWAGTDSGGLDRIRPKVFDSPADLPARDAQSLSPDADGGFWTAFNATGFYHRTENGAVENYPVGTLHGAWAVLVTKQQQVFAGTPEEGLFLWDGTHFTPAPDAQVLGRKIFSLAEDADGKIFAGTTRGLGMFDGQKWKLFTARDGLAENFVRTIARATDGGLWVGTESKGLNRFKDGRFVPVQNLPVDDISCLCAGGDGVLWVGTYGHGLAFLKDGKWKTISTRDGLASDSVSYVFEDGGYLWVGSNLGLMRLQKRSLEAFAGGQDDFLYGRTYGKADGLPTRECSIGSQPAACRTIDGKLWFPTTKGVASLDPSDVKTNLLPPVVMIESILVDGRQQKTNALASVWPRSVTVAPGGDRSKLQLEIHYTALDFSAPDRVRFKYQLEGYQADWTDAGNERVVRYLKLPPGHYRFHLVAYNEDGGRNVNDGSFEVIVLPQFWQTTWFLAGTIILALVIIIALVRYVSTQKLQRQIHAHKQREALEHERSRIARDLHDQLGANLTQVALLGEMAETDKHVPDEVEAHAQQISQTARETTRALDEIVWAVNPANDTLEGLANYAFKYAQEFLGLAGVRCRVDAPAQVPALSIPPEVRHNVFLAFKEAVNNVVKHAHAGEAHIRLRTREAAIKTGIFIIEIEDNGHGIKDLESKKHRSGLRNMRQRMEDIGGSFEIGPRQDGGTIVRLIVPVNK